MCSMKLQTPCHRSKMSKKSPCRENNLSLFYDTSLKKNTNHSSSYPRTYNLRPNRLFPRILDIGHPSLTRSRSNLTTSMSTMSTSTPSTSSVPDMTRPAAPTQSNDRKRSAAEISRERQCSDSVCTMCTDSEKMRRPHHFSSSSIRRLMMSQSKEKDKNYICQVCQSLELCLRNSAGNIGQLVSSAGHPGGRIDP